ncbi:enamine deaminase RidA (YjgF/YER057c/UK114 family) [Loktanella ponticola]|uniref:Enamine deaminase RidA (YjgF/YER057c/UK114 family) n=1 Tax=Yoonia ponticola TaxID=1524255 RepID=A0A7W9BMN4_9RHOB|nr:RidA family protein [Yoonia ponticola]MBB5722849.1 enamine deaminase RidA (YjgF/YER057c/UK114 family) [Yoonia ponticola]
MKRIASGGIFEDKIGYCRAVVAGGFVHVSGCTYPGADVPTDVVAQCAGALDVIGQALEKAGVSFADVIRVTYMLPDPEDFAPCWLLLRETFGDNPPAATMVSCGLIDPKYKIEIEVMALAPAA